MAYRFSAGKVDCINFLFKNRESTFTVEITVDRRGPQIALKASNGKSHMIDLSKWEMEATWGEKGWYAAVAYILVFIFDRRAAGEAIQCARFLATRLPVGARIGTTLTFDSTFLFRVDS